MLSAAASLLWKMGELAGRGGAGGGSCRRCFHAPLGPGWRHFICKTKWRLVGQWFALQAACHCPVFAARLCSAVTLPHYEALQQLLGSSGLTSRQPAAGRGPLVRLSLQFRIWRSIEFFYYRLWQRVRPIIYFSNQWISIFCDLGESWLARNYHQQDFSLQCNNVGYYWNRRKLDEDIRK